MEHKRRYFEKNVSIFCLYNERQWWPNQLCYQQASKYIRLCSTKERFKTTWGWVNYDWIEFFWVNYPFNVFIIIIIIIIIIIYLFIFMKWYTK